MGKGEIGARAPPPRGQRLVVYGRLRLSLPAGNPSPRSPAGDPLAKREGGPPTPTLLLGSCDLIARLPDLPGCSANERAKLCSPPLRKRDLGSAPLQCKGDVRDLA